MRVVVERSHPAETISAARRRAPIRVCPPGRAVVSPMEALSLDWPRAGLERRTKLWRLNASQTRGEFLVHPKREAK